MLNPQEAAVLGGEATLTTHPDGRASRHLRFNVYARDFMYGGAVAAAGLLFIVLGLQKPELKLAFLAMGIPMLAIGAVMFALGVRSLRPEKVRMARDVLRIESAGTAKDIPWTAIREVRSDNDFGGTSTARANISTIVRIKSDAGDYTMQWWRFPLDEQRQFFIYASTRVLPRGTPVVDNLRWLPSDKADRPSVTSTREQEYRTIAKGGGIMMLLGLILVIGLFINLSLIGVVGIMLLFIGFMCAVAGSAGIDDERKKNRQKGP